MNSSNNSRNLYLIGPMGAGKTTTGALLANKIGYKFIDTDEIIEQHTGLAIVDFFNKFSENEFRKLETNILQQVSVNANQVISTGGGMILSAINIKIMRNTGIVFYLKLGIIQQYKRLKNNLDNRPLLKNSPNKISLVLKQMAKKRNPIYKQAAHYTIDATSPDYIDQITKVLLVSSDYSGR